MSNPKQSIVYIDGQTLSLKQAEDIAYGSNLSIKPEVRRKVEISENYIKQVSKKNVPIYGVNTGYGFLANKRVSKTQLNALQVNLIKSHAAGWGDLLSIPETRLAMALRLNVLIKGFAGVSWELCESLLNLIQAHIYPLIPEFGSVGASGDLAPLAHLALPLLGLGKANFKDKIISSNKALKLAKLRPYTLKPKEGIALINGTQIMLSIGCLALSEALRLIQKAEKITALTFEALEGHISALNPLIHENRGHPGQIQSARLIISELEGSILWSPKLKHLRVQDPYSIRCAPQVHGASREALNYTLQVIERELNAATDNPLVFAQDNCILSGGNFHGQPLAMAFDVAAMAVSELANISERRLELLLNPHMSHLPPFLTPKPGIQSGYMAAQYLSASLVNENKIHANPACTDSIPGNVGIEDHVSMGMTSARKLKRIVKNAATVLAIELMAACQAIDLREPKKLGQGTQRSYNALRTILPKLTSDRIIAEDISKAVEVFHQL